MLINGSNATKESTLEEGEGEEELLLLDHNTTLVGNTTLVNDSCGVADAMGIAGAEAGAGVMDTRDTRDAALGVTDAGMDEVVVAVLLMAQAPSPPVPSRLHGGCPAR